jgi:hypothetical protein
VRIKQTKEVKHRWLEIGGLNLCGVMLFWGTSCHDVLSVSWIWTPYHSEYLFDIIFTIPANQYPWLLSFTV